MSKTCPELIFVAGPQKSQRVRLTRPACVLGRGAGCDILLSEEYVSRQHARYELLQVGPTLENLSPRGTWINGKRFKAGKKVQVETGDLIGVGAETQMLFVAAGDDPIAAINEFVKDRKGGKDAFGRKISPEPAAAPPPEAPGEAQEPQEQGDAEVAAEEEQARRPSDMTAGEREQAEQTARRRKLVVGLGIYVGCIVLAGIVIGMIVNVGGPRVYPEQPILTNDRIREELASLLKRTPNPVQKDRKLQEARGLYQQYGINPRYLNLVTHTFKESLAYSGKSFFDSTEDQRIYNECMDEFTKAVRQRYRDACKLEMNKDWAVAADAFRDLLAVVGDQHKVVFENVQHHYSRSKYYHQQTQPKKNPMWGGT